MQPEPETSPSDPQIEVRRTGAGLFFDVLTDLGVEIIFGHTGGAVIPLHVELNKRLRRGECVHRCRANVRAVREAEVEQQELPLEVRVRAGPAVEVHERPRPAQRRLPVTRHLAQSYVRGRGGRGEEEAEERMREGQAATRERRERWKGVGMRIEETYPYGVIQVGLTFF